MKRILTLLAFVALTITANAVIQSGSCGDNVTFVLNDDGTLVISGSGEMENYYSWDFFYRAPWYYDNREKIIKVQIEDGVTSIGEAAFFDCSDLTSITIPNSVTSIGDDAFDGCSSLTSVTIPNSVTSIGEIAFRYCYNLTSVTIPNSVTSIGDYAFCQCSRLTSITIGNSVTSIGIYAFYGCYGLTSITIPNSVTRIGYGAFAFCSGLKEIHSQAIAPPRASTDTFNGVSKNDCKLYVPIGTKEGYASAEVWKEFINIIEEGTTAITLSDISNKYGDVEFYTLNGVKVDVPNKSGIYVVKKNGETKMVVVKK